MEKLWIVYIRETVDETTDPLMAHAAGKDKFFNLSGSFLAKAETSDLAIKAVANLVGELEKPNQKLVAYEIEFDANNVTPNNF